MNKNCLIYNYAQHYRFGIFSLLDKSGEYDMYFGGVCVSGLNNNVFSFGDKRRGDTSWES